MMKVKYEEETKIRKQGIGLPVPAGMLLIIAGSLLAALTIAGWLWAAFLIIFGISLLLYHFGDRTDGRIPMAVFLISLIFLGIALFSQSEWLKALLNSRQ
jgi:hypothetical protein